MFFDEVALEAFGGKGGNGMVSFYRAKYVPYGPPDGGDGGKGGDVYLIADYNYNTLRHFSGKKRFEAMSGEGGHKNHRAGAEGKDLEVPVPVGTLVFDNETGEKICDLNRPGQRVLIARGGRGGYGNGHFVSSVRQAPKFAELGDIGEERKIRLELQMIADIGLLGFPSAGKSTLISHLSAAKPKIADYPFTTLIPNLGVVQLSEFGGGKEQSFIIADMPGIIEGASEGKGLGSTFLKHISRAASLVYILDPFSYTGLSLSEQFKILKEELKTFDASLLKKAYLLVINKIDAIPEEDREELKAEFLKEFPEEVKRLRLISGVSGEQLQDLVFELWRMVQENRETFSEGEPSILSEEAIPQYQPTKFIDPQSFTVEKMYDIDLFHFEAPVHSQLIPSETKPKRQLFKVLGERIEQISRMTNVDQAEGILRVYDVMKKMNIDRELVRAGAVLGDLIKIGPHIFEFHSL